MVISCSSFRLKVSFCAFAVGFLCLLLTEAFVLQLTDPNAITATGLRTTLSLNAATDKSTTHLKDVDHHKVFRDGSSKPSSDLSYVASKRKVPRGPDPIHNRRAGNSRRPPGRS